MKGIKIKLKPIRVSLLLMVAMSLPSLAMAQDQSSGGGLFGLGPTSDNVDYTQRSGLMNPTGGGYNIGTQQFGDNTNGGFNIGTQQFGQEVPLGSGWLVMTVAGVAYAFKKRKNNNKQ